MSEQEQNKQMNIELSEDVAQGIYSNLAIITHSHSEFFIDFAGMAPGLPKAEVKSRIIMTPEHAKSLLMALQENVARYEANFGKIRQVEPGNKNFPMNFGTPTAKA